MPSTTHAADPAALLAALGGPTAAAAAVAALTAERDALERDLARAPPAWLRHCAAERRRREAADDRVAELTKEISRVRLALRVGARQ